MKSTTRTRPASKPIRRKPRLRGTPKWLLARQDLDDLARRRCLLILSVLSGERAVTDAIAEAGMSRQSYYNLEEQALRAMLAALTPFGQDAASTAESPAKRVAELQQKVQKLEREKRRGERLLFLARKVVKCGPMTTGGGWPRGRPRSSTTPGPKPSRGSSSKLVTPVASAPPSTPTPDGAAAS